ncbi:DUF4011 domain-containing protein [Nesterenkonia xinjiangensis]|uniref:AAA domain-containing protein n=1 Tax=Nesterenkonia xinjiangensis TaxID=225327 RepID=A0A7Z0GJ56_9MICC|nr:hypothetical protein [Nesterenkonia xinjiangensis]
MSRDESTSEERIPLSDAEIEAAAEAESQADDFQPADTSEFTQSELAEIRTSVTDDPVTAWVEALHSGTENDTMLRFTPSQHNAIDLTESNSSGLMQLLAGRKTRLSTLLNESGAFAAGQEAARRIRAKVREMSTERGIDVGFLAAGVASWTETTDAGAEQFTAPVMLVPVALRPRAEHDDYEVQFTAPARLNPALARHMLGRHGITLDAEEFHATGYATARFDPVRTADLLSRLVSESVDALQVWRQTYISTFADLADLGNPEALDREHPVLRALATSDRLDAPAVEAVPLDARDPREEKLVADADPDQQKALDAIEAGASVVVSAPPGTGQTQTAINAAAALAWTGKRTLVVAERASTLEEFRLRMKDVRLGTLALHVPASAGGQDLREQMVRAIKRAERAEPPRLGALHQRLVDRRHQLLDHVKSLHNLRTRWSCSPYQAMQALAALTSLSPAPSTPVRLKRSVLDNTVDRSQVTVKLRRAAELGAFASETRSSPWYNARLRNRQETEDAMALVQDLREELPKLKAQMEVATAVTGVKLGESFSAWHAQVLLFQRVQESLGRFSHDVYAKPVDDLIAATAPGWWRRQHGVEMTSMVRSRLRRVAKEYVRSGVSINDLHSSLIDVQAEREEWARQAVEESLPKVPKSLDRLADTIGHVQTRLEKLVGVLRPVDPDDATDHDLLDMPAETMIATVETLAEDEKPLETLPERTLVTEQLREQGFRELMEDFAEREVPAAQVADEMELAWWQSALEAMISGDDYLAMTTGENLRTIESEFREADAAHVETGAQRLTHALAVRWKSAVESHAEAATRLKTLLRDAEPTVAGLGAVDDALIQPLVPVWTTSPLGLSEQFPAEARFDAVILLDAETLSVPAALGAISRADQVIAFGDPVSGTPKPFHVSADPVAREAEQQVPASIFSELVEVLPQHQLRRVHRGVDQELTGLLSEALYDGELLRIPDAAQLTGQGRRLVVEHLGDALGRPGARDSVESPTVEVNRVVDMVFDHVRTRKDSSLAVITGSEWHARRVADAIRVNLANHTWARPFFETEEGEGFVVAPVERAHHLVRDRVIFSLGYGRSIKGEPVHHFGDLSEARGEELFAVATTRARGELTVVTSLAPGDLDPAGLERGAALMHRLITLGLEGTDNPTASGSLTDPLVLDLVDRIRARGGRVEDGFRGTLDLAACPRKISPQSPVTPLAMVSDGTDSYAEMSVRERSRQRPADFEALGWNYLVLWTIEVFSDPIRCTEVVAEKVGLAEGPEFAEHGRIALNTTGALAERLPRDGAGSRVRFGGAADAEDEDSHRRATTWASPRERGKWVR